MKDMLFLDEISSEDEFVVSTSKDEAENKQFIENVIEITYRIIV